MKQTNNAIKFLMAQYRAIFQNAYFKGLAAAAVVTMGLAAGQAQAAAISDATAWGNLTGTENVVSGTETITLSGDSITNTNTFTLNITSSGDHVIKSGTVSAANGEIIYNNTAAQGSLSIQTDTKAGVLDVNKFTLTQGTVNISGDGSALKAATLTLGGEAVEDGKALITLASGAFVGKSGSTATDFNTALTLNKGAKITTSGDSSGSIYAAKLNMNDGAISASGSSATATLTLNVNQGAINGGTLEAGQSGSLAINLTKIGETVGDVSINNGDIKVASGSTLTISGEGTLSIADEAVFSGAGKDTSVTISGGAQPLTVELSKTQFKEIADNSKLTLTSGSLNFTDALDLATDITLTDGNSAGLKADSGSKIGGANITVSNVITSGGEVSVAADKLTLGSDKYDGSKSLGFKDASAKTELVFVNNSGSDSFKLQDSVSVKNVDASGAALTGSIKGNVNLDAQNKNLSVLGGDYKYDGNIWVCTVEKDIKSV